MSELSIITIAREKGLLIQNFNQLVVGDEYMLIPKNIARKKLKFGIFKIIRKGITRDRSFRLEGETSSRLFTNYHFLTVNQEAKDGKSDRI